MLSFPCFLIVQDKSLTSWRRIIDEDHLTEELGRIACFPKLRVLGWSDRQHGIIRPLTLAGQTREPDVVPAYPLDLVTTEITTGKELRIRVRSPKDVEETIRNVARAGVFRIIGWAEIGQAAVRTDFEELWSYPQDEEQPVDNIEVE